MESIPVSSPNRPMPPEYRHTACPTSLDRIYTLLLTMQNGARLLGQTVVMNPEPDFLQGPGLYLVRKFGIGITRPVSKKNRFSFRTLFQCLLPKFAV
mgnify:CR=1 FL=1